MDDNEKSDITSLSGLGLYDHHNDKTKGQTISGVDPNIDPLDTDHDFSDQVENDFISEKIQDDDEVITLHKGKPQLSEQLEDFSHSNFQLDQSELNFDHTIPEYNTDPNRPLESSFNISINQDAADFVTQGHEGQFLTEKEYTLSFGVPPEIQTLVVPEKKSKLVSESQKEIPKPASITPVSKAKTAVALPPKKIETPKIKSIERDPNETLLLVTPTTVDTSTDLPFDSKKTSSPLPEGKLPQSVKNESTFAPKIIPIQEKTFEKNEKSSIYPDFTNQKMDLNKTKMAAPPPKTPVAQPFNLNHPATGEPKSSQTLSTSPRETTHGVPTKAETFSDLRDFAEHVQYGEIQSNANPPFSLIIKNIHYKEDADEVLRTLRELKLVNAQNQTIYEKSAQSGHVLISQISEYIAIYLAHKFRNMEADILVGLSDDLNPSQFYATNSRGLVNKSHVFQNKSEHQNLEQKVRPQDIIVSTFQQLPGRNNEKYLGILTETKIIDQKVFESLPKEMIENDDPVSNKNREFSLLKELHHGDIELSVYEQDMAAVYQQLFDSLRAKAVLINANAVLGISLQITPFFPALHQSHQPQNPNEQTAVQYRITCTGNAVRIT